MGLREGMSFLPVQQFAVEDGASYKGLPFPRDGQSAYADRHRPEPLRNGLKHGVFLTMPEMPDPEVSGKGHRFSTCMCGPRTSRMDSTAVHLFFSIIEDHIISREGMFDPGQAVGQSDSRPPRGRGGDKNVHIINIITELTLDGLLGNRAEESLGHIFSEGAPGDEPMMALGRQGDRAMGPEQPGATVSGHDEIEGHSGTAGLMGTGASLAVFDSFITLGAVKEGKESVVPLVMS